MVQSKAATVEQYLDELPPGRREVVSEVRKTILEYLPEGYMESMLEDYPDTYNGQPLGYLALAAQKNYYSLYMMGVYGDAEQEAKLEEGFKEAGKKLDMGKSCVRFRKLEDVPLDVIGEVVASTAPQAMIAQYEKSRKK